MNRTVIELREKAISVAYEFNSRFLDNNPAIFAIGDEPLGTWAISDQFWSLEDMALTLNSQLTPDELYDWYSETIERQANGESIINLKSYISGERNYDTYRTR